MRPGSRILVGGAVLLGLIAGLSPAQPAAEGYTPVTPAPGVHAALKSSLKTYQDWIDDKDFASAAEAAQCSSVLAHLYAHQGADKTWREPAAALTDACSRLAAAAKKKDRAECAKLIDECHRRLDELAKAPPAAPAPDKAFKPLGASRTWMLLLDASYSDAKTAKSARELELLAYAIAEESNAMQYLRAEGRWRQFSRETRDAALGVAAKAKADDLPGAKAALKTVYARCDSCHNGYKK